MDNSSTKAIEEAIRWQRYIAKAGKTPEQKARAAERIERLEACLEIRKGFLDGR
jgi:hypothetical protein